jgi:hypothetical protein
MTTEIPKPSPLVAPEGFLNKLLDKTPSAVLSFISSLVAIVLSFSIMGVDLAHPMQKITDAYAESIAANTQGALKFDAAVAQLEIVKEEQRKTINELKEQVIFAIAANSKAVDEISVAVQGVRDMVIRLEQRIVILEASAHAPHNIKQK